MALISFLSRLQYLFAPVLSPHLRLVFGGTNVSVSRPDIAHRQIYRRLVSGDFFAPFNAWRDACDGDTPSLSAKEKFLLRYKSFSKRAITSQID